MNEQTIGSHLDFCSLFVLISFMGCCGDESLPFRVEVWDDKDQHIDELIALVSDFSSAVGAFEEAVKRRPGKLITLRQQARVIKKSRQMLCDCGGQLIEMDRYGERLTGCMVCNRWRSSQRAFVVHLSIEDYEALRKLNSNDAHT